jgi:hypothetical protein
MLKKAYVSLRIKSIFFFFFLTWLVFGKDDAVFVSKPLAGINKAFAEIVHHKVYCVSMRPTHEASECVVSSVEG